MGFKRASNGLNISLPNYFLAIYWMALFFAAMALLEIFLHMFDS